MTGTMFLLVCAVPLKADAATNSHIKSALIINLCHHVIWPELQQDTFVIASYGPSTELELLQALAGEQTLHGKPVEIISSTDIHRLRQAQVVYVAEEHSSQIPRIAPLLRQSETLVITEAPASNHSDTMINLVPQKKKYGFLINKPNMLFENLSFARDIFDLGGEEISPIELYQSSEARLRDSQKEIEQLSIKLQQNVKEQQKAATRLSQQDNELSQLQESLRASQQQFLVSKQELINQAEFYTKKEQELQQLSDTLQEKEQAISVQQETVNQLTNEINQQLALFNQVEADILSQSQQLSTQTSKIQQQNQQIEIQNTLVLVSFLVLAIVTLAAIIIYRQFLVNKRTNKDLSHALSVLKDTQGKLIESEKMASLGNLVTGMAHELNTPIGTSICCISALGERVKDVETAIHTNSLTKTSMLEFLSTVQESEQLLTSSLQRCATLVHNFKQVSADQVVAEPREIKLLNYLGEILGTLSVQLKRAGIQYSLDGDNPTMTLDPGLLVQIITNLTMNAINHAFDGIKSPQLHVLVTEEKKHVLLEFIDNGVGMNDEVRHKIFDPFFTTKRGIGGTGLGMNIVYTLVTVQLHGDIEVQSQPNQGAHFIIRLPLS